MDPRQDGFADCKKYTIYLPRIVVSPDKYECAFIAILISNEFAILGDKLTIVQQPYSSGIWLFGT